MLCFAARAGLAAAAVCLSTSVAAAQSADFAGRFALVGQDSEGRSVSASLAIRQTESGWTLERQSAGRAWTTHSVQRSGDELRVRFVDPAEASSSRSVGLSGRLSGRLSGAESTGQVRLLEARYRLIDGAVRERVWRPETKSGDAWAWQETQGRARDTSADDELRRLIAAAGVVTPQRPAPEPKALVELGRDLFFDKVLSGNKNISCATCHHPAAGSGDDLPLPIGQGGSGGARARRPSGEGQIVPRNAPAVFNDGLDVVSVLMWDGRIARDPASGVLTTPEAALNGANPARPDLVAPLDHVLAAQAMFPVTSAAEMRGHPGENEIADAKDNVEVWSRLMARLGEIPAYRERFAAAFPGQAFDELSFGHAGRAIAAFERASWTALDTPFDRYLAGDDDALTRSEKWGARMFFGKARCATCHNGPRLSDGQQHALAVPQLGPGKEASGDDRGLALVSGNRADDYKFLTPSLRNVAETGPYMHSGAFTSLRSAVVHHLDAVKSSSKYRVSQLPELYRPLVDVDETRRQAREAALSPTLRQPIKLTHGELTHLLFFLETLTDKASLEVTVPKSVPSGLPVAD